MYYRYGIGYVTWRPMPAIVSWYSAMHLYSELVASFLKIIKDVFTFHIISWILIKRRRPDSQWSNPTCCLSYTVNTMPVDAMVLWRSLGARASESMGLITQKPEYSFSSIRRGKISLPAD